MRGTRKENANSQQAVWNGNGRWDNRSRPLQAFFQDLSFGIRTLARRPLFALVTILTLALGVGANTAIFSLIEGILLKPLPYPHSERLVVLEDRNEAGAVLPTSFPNFRDWRRGSQSFQAMTALVDFRTTVLGAGAAQRVPAQEVSADFFKVVDVQPALGRPILTTENRAGGPAVVVVSQRLWSQLLGRTTDLSKASLTFQDISGRNDTYQVIGVMPEGFRLLFGADLWIPLQRRVPWTVRGNHVLTVVGRLAPGVAPAAAGRQLDALQGRIHQAHAGETDAVGISTQSLQERVVGPTRRPLLLLMVAAAFLLLVTCTNLASALLGLASSRLRELAVRASLGAGRWRLVRQLLTENLLLAAGSGLAGMVMASGALQLVRALAPRALPRLQQVQLDGRAILFAAGLALLTTLLFGLGPALRGTGGALSARLRRSGAGDGVQHRAGWRILVAAEVALALVLLVGSGLLLRSLWGILNADLGFDSGGVVTARVDPPLSKFRTQAAYVEYFEQAVARLRSLPGVKAAGVGNLLPIQGEGNVGGPVELEGRRSEQKASYRVAGAGFFQAMGIRLIRGRVFGPDDGPGTPHVAVINQSMARTFWPGEEALGRRFRIPGMDPYGDQPLTVIGIVQEARRWNQPAGSAPTYYVDYRQRPDFLALTGAELVVRGSSVGAIAHSVRDAVVELNPDVPVRVSSLRERLRQAVADRRLTLALLAIFAALAVFLASLGVYGVVSHSVSRRTREIAVRMALGARPGQIWKIVLGETLVSVATGSAVGIATALVLGRFLQSLLYGIQATDPLTFAGALLTLGMASALAGCIPARRSTRLDPARVLRTE